MTPYVVNNDSDSPPRVSQAPKSIMVNGDPPGQIDDKKAGTPESIASYPSSSKSVPNGNGKLGKGALKRWRNELLSYSEERNSLLCCLLCRSVVFVDGEAFFSGTGKMVSFGSSKGSMVETLVYDHHEELPYLPSFATSPPNDGNPPNLPAKVRVSFYESQRPHYVTTPDSPDIPLDICLSIMPSPSEAQPPHYDRQQSTDSGIDNPFRPDGELSREADTIVSLIKEGKPITPVKGEPDKLIPTEEEPPIEPKLADQVDCSPPSKVEEDSIVLTKANAVECTKVGANGSAPKDTSPAEPSVVEVQHGVIVPPSDASQVEQVVIKKKPKCKCCVIQ